MKPLLVAPLARPSLQGCVVSQSASTVSYIGPGKTVAEFDSPNGNSRLRRHLDGSFGLRLSDQRTQYAEPFRVVLQEGTLL